MGYPVIMNGDHAEFEAEWAGKDPKTRPDWPLPSFDAADWAAAFCKVANEDLGYRDPEGKPIDEGWMIAWFANALMRGFDEHAARSREDCDVRCKRGCTLKKLNTMLRASKNRS